MLDFSIIETGNTKAFIFLDNSDYDSRPGNPLVEIKFPSVSEIYKSIIIPKTTNIITTKSLNYDCNIIDLPDGLYHFKYSIEPNNYLFICKNIVRFAKTKCKIKNLLLSETITQEAVNKLYELDVLMEAAQTVADTNKTKAIEYFNLIQREIKKLECNGL